MEFANRSAEPDEFPQFIRELENALEGLPARGETTPTPTAFSGTFTGATATVRYMRILDRCFFNASVVITTNGTADGYVSVPMPFPAREVAAQTGTDVTGFVALCGYITGSNLLIKKYDNTYPGATGKTLRMTGHYRISR